MYTLMTSSVTLPRLQQKEESYTQKVWMRADAAYPGRGDGLAYPPCAEGGDIHTGADIEQPTQEKFDIVDRPHPQTSEGF
jgi:hypothetical protein